MEAVAVADAICAPDASGDVTTYDVIQVIGLIFTFMTQSTLDRVLTSSPGGKLRSGTYHGVIRGKQEFPSKQPVGR